MRTRGAEDAPGNDDRSFGVGTAGASLAMLNSARLFGRLDLRKDSSAGLT